VATGPPARDQPAADTAATYRLIGSMVRSDILRKANVAPRDQPGLQQRNEASRPVQFSPPDNRRERYKRRYLLGGGVNDDPFNRMRPQPNCGRTGRGLPTSMTSDDTADAHLIQASSSKTSPFSRPGHTGIPVSGGKWNTTPQLEPLFFGQDLV